MSYSADFYYVEKARKRRAGECRSCPAPAVPGGKQCVSCRERERERVRARRAAAPPTQARRITSETILARCRLCNVPMFPRELNENGVCLEGCEPPLKVENFIGRTGELDGELRVRFRK